MDHLLIEEQTTNILLRIQRVSQYKKRWGGRCTVRFRSVWTCCTNWRISETKQYFLFHTTSLDQSTEILIYVKTANFLITTVYLD